MVISCRDGDEVVAGRDVGLSIEIFAPSEQRAVGSQCEAVITSRRYRGEIVPRRCGSLSMVIKSHPTIEPSVLRARL